MTDDNRLKTRIGASVLNCEKEAVQDLYDQIVQENMDTVIFFCSSKYDLKLLGAELKQHFPCLLIGCTSAGEISNKGYQDGGIVGVSLSSTELKAHAHVISNLREFDFEEVKTLAETVRKELSYSENFDRKKMFGLLMIDGMSMLEEHVIAMLHSQFEAIDIAGGSAGDDQGFAETKIYSDGEFISNAAVFTVFETTLQFSVFHTQHFKPTDKKLVITEADPASRIVYEINAEPAAEAFASTLGISVEALGPSVFSQHPLMLKIGDRWYVRSIRKVNKDGSLSFYCAIDVGLVLTVATCEDLVSNLKDELDDLNSKISPVQLILCFDCILRKLEINGKELKSEINGVLANYRVVGFNTYGEQFNSVHVNQTLTGIAIGGS